MKKPDETRQIPNDEAGMWTLQHCNVQGEDIPWNGHKEQSIPQALQEAGGRNAGPFLHAVLDFVSVCRDLSHTSEEGIERISESNQRLETVVHELNTAPVLRFGVIMATEDFQKKLMLAQERLQYRDGIAQQQSAQEGESTVRINMQEFRESEEELKSAVEHAQNAASAVILACEAAWNGSRMFVEWDPPELDIPEE